MCFKIKVMHVSNNKNNINFKNISVLSNALGAFHNANATIPTLIIESGVTLGRSHEANKRGGKIEATERFVEQGTSALIWIYGVQALKKTGDFIGKKLFKIENLDTDIGFDILRNPMANVKTKYTKGFKIANILTSTALATGFIGFILPKINHAITNKTLKKEKNDKSKTLLKPMSMSNYLNTTKNNNIAFTSLIDKGMALSHILENNSTARLLITDTGVVGGRFKNGRNKYEKIEGLFRDLASIYFYLFSTKHCVKLFNKIAGIKDINPKIIEKTTELLKNTIGDKTISADELKKLLDENISKENLEKLNTLFKDKQKIPLIDFEKAFGENLKALEMVKLQPFFETDPVLTKMQAKDVLSSSITSDPKVIKEAMSLATNGASDNPKKFVSKKYLENLRKQMDDFIQEICKKGEDKVINKEFIEDIAKKNIGKNFAFYSLATGISIYALAFLIPKVQYFITKKLTNQNEFPGTKEYK